MLWTEERRQWWYIQQDIHLLPKAANSSGGIRVVQLSDLHQTPALVTPKIGNNLPCTFYTSDAQLLCLLQPNNSKMLFLRMVWSVPLCNTFFVCNFSETLVVTLEVQCKETLDVTNSGIFCHVLMLGQGEGLKNWIALKGLNSMSFSSICKCWCWFVTKSRICLF